MTMRGLLSDFEGAMMSPLFLGGAALLSGEGWGGAMKGMQAGQQFGQQRRQQQQEIAARDAMRQGIFGSAHLRNMSDGERNMLAANPAMAQHVLGAIYQHQYDPQARLRSQLLEAQIAAQRAEASMMPMKMEHMRAQTGMTQAHTDLYRAQAAQKETPDQAFGVRAEQARRYGLAEGSPAYQAYVLTGKMPREDQQPLSATDKKAIIEAEDDAFKAREAASKAQSALGLNSLAYQGPMAGLRGYLTSFLGSPGGLATGQFRDLVGELTLDSLKTTFGGNPTEGERAALMDLQASVNKPVEQRRLALERVISVLGRREHLEGQRATQLRGGTYFRPGGGSDGGQSPQKLGGQAPARDATPMQQQQPQPPAEVEKVLNGKRYIKRGGSWFEADQ